MTSKEIIQSKINELNISIDVAIKSNYEIMKKCCQYDLKKYNQVLKDLEELEELKKIMGTPIQEIMKRLKILELLKPYCHLVYDDINHEWHFIIGYEEIDEDYFKNEVDLVVSGEEANKIRDWLNE